ncbi:hypothetical protein F9C11_17800 [Amycolatopsis sp. VS8301801F10]|uniref:hypothetical protein n=1 Tax=Amycolatopsis sp. VS8301801F10 TaxID=2652442 RepID=UPI0038FCF0C5
MYDAIEEHVELIAAYGKTDDPRGGTAQWRRSIGVVDSPIDGTLKRCLNLWVPETLS